MKKLITIALLFAVFVGKGQGFEGTIKWTMRLEITDPKRKAEMEEMQKKMNDPATQAKMKEFEAQMKDPQMKAMMDANPQMKAQMEARMKMMQSGGGMNSMMPSGFTVKIKNGNRLTLMEGGMMASELLYQKEKGQTVSLDRANKTYSIMPAGGGNPNRSMGTPKVTKTMETMKILGYNAIKYVVEVAEAGQTFSQNIWTTTEISDVDMKSFKERIGQGQALFYEGMEGVPLKVESVNKDGNMIMEATEIKRESLNAADFTIPADFKEVPMTGRF